MKIEVTKTSKEVDLKDSKEILKPLKAQITKEKKIPKKELKTSSKIINAPDTKEEIENTYFTNVSKTMDIKITKVKETTIKLHGRSQKVHHVIVKAKKKTGPASSFEALVDLNSSTVYKTWNQTRFETNKPFKIKAAGLEFYSK